MLLLQAPTAAIGCEAGALQEDTEAPSHEAAAHKATSVDSSPDVSLAPEVAWAQERLSEDDARFAFRRESSFSNENQVFRNFVRFSYHFCEGGKPLAMRPGS